MTATAGPTSPWPPVLRVMGIETEYGISALGQTPGEDLHPMQLSNHVVKGYGWTTTTQPAGWDYETETPLRDIRGYEISRNQAHPDQLTDADLGMANVILTNGARLYVDHAQQRVRLLVAAPTEDREHGDRHDVGDERRKCLHGAEHYAARDAR